MPKVIVLLFSIFSVIIYLALIYLVSNEEKVTRGKIA